MNHLVRRFDVPGFAGITLREAGDMGPSSSPAIEERRIVFHVLDDTLGPAGRALIVIPQQHSKTVHRVDSTWRRHLPAGDGMVTDDPNAVVAVTVADCLPIYLWDEAVRCRGIVHSGWRGTGIAAVAAGRMRECFGADGIRALIGPGICGACYRVDDSRFEYFRSNWGSECVARRGGELYVDLAKANECVLESAGVREIHRLEECTRENSAYSSYRRDGPGFRRMLAFFAAVPNRVKR